MKSATIVLAACALFVSTALAADPMYVGKWKFNAAKSTLSGDTVTIENAANGMMKFDSQGFAYTFKLDGKDYPMPNGGTTAWTATSATVWDVTNKMNGKVSNTYHLVLSANTLALSGNTMRPDGQAMAFTSSYKRVSGGPGFAGKWMSTEVKLPSIGLEISTSGANGITLKDDTGTTMSGQFDSKDYPAQGPMAGTKTSNTFRKISDTSFEITSKLDGKPLYVDVYTVSADGKTLTDTGTPSNAKSETYKVVFEKQ